MKNDLHFSVIFISNYLVLSRKTVIFIYLKFSYHFKRFLWATSIWLYVIISVSLLSAFLTPSSSGISSLLTFLPFPGSVSLRLWRSTWNGKWYAMRLCCQLYYPYFLGSANTKYKNLYLRRFSQNFPSKCSVQRHS